jgi:hypothetical protein
MALVIRKEVLKETASQVVNLPANAEILCAQEQRGKVCIWFRCDPNAESVYRQIQMVDTGEKAPADSESRYLGTVMLDDGRTVVHVFEMLPVKIPDRESPVTFTTKEMRAHIRRVAQTEEAPPERDFLARAVLVLLDEFEQQQMFEVSDGVFVHFNPSGRFHGWLFQRHPDGHFVSVRKLAAVRPYPIMTGTP